MGDVPNLRADLSDGISAVGGGASPDASIGTTLIELQDSELSEAQLEMELRLAEIPVIARIESGRVILDLRTVGESEEAELIEILAGIGQRA
jgi:L-seryl-tRNA(Ser) seleniumtransferase